MFLFRKIMDNIFGKEDSGDESEHNDIEDKNDKESCIQISDPKDIEVMETDNAHVKV